MKTAVFCVVSLAVSMVSVAAEAAPASAPEQDASGFTCWYDPGGHYTGADSADPRFPARQVTRGTTGGDYSYGFTFAGPSTNCPRQLPPDFYTQPPVYLLRGKLSAIQNRHSHATVLLLHDEISNSDYGLTKCAKTSFNPNTMSRYVGKSVLVTGVYDGGAFCPTGFMPPS